MHGFCKSPTEQDHPRIRGTNARLYLATAIGSGSSPHTRDKYDLRVNRRLLERIIPAYAGQMSLFRLFYRLLQDHPRIRGTNHGNCGNRRAVAGSSPHTRDKSYINETSSSTDRIIPAYAGQMQEKVPLKHKTQDHPRIRGTNIASATDTPVDLGSSPHTRDKFHEMPFAKRRSRIIPAYAGQI